MAHGDTEGRTPEDVTTERGDSYGHPLEQFGCAEAMFDIWSQRRNSGKPLPHILELALRHFAHMVCTKLSRLAHDPLLMDGYADVAGYAKCMEMCIAKQEEGEAL